jgi:murein DD-endopeptidase MepM/ murein hydrolase activator NlpD
MSPELGLSPNDGNTVITSQEIVEETGQQADRDRAEQHPQGQVRTDREIDALARQAIEGVEEQLRVQGPQDQPEAMTREQSDNNAENFSTPQQEESQLRQNSNVEAEEQTPVENQESPRSLPRPLNNSNDSQEQHAKTQENPSTHHEQETTPRQETTAPTITPDNIPSTPENTREEQTASPEDNQPIYTEENNSNRDNTTPNVQQEHSVNDRSESETRQDNRETSSENNDDAEERDDVRRDNPAVVEAPEVNTPDIVEQPERDRSSTTRDRKISKLNDEEIKSMLGMAEKPAEPETTDIDEPDISARTPESQSRILSNSAPETDEMPELNSERLRQRNNQPSVLLPGFTEENEVKAGREDDIVREIKDQASVDSLEVELESIARNAIASVERRGSVQQIEQMRAEQSEAVLADVTATEAHYEQTEQEFLDGRHEELRKYTNQDTSETPLRMLYDDEAFEVHLNELQEQYEQSKAERLEALAQFKDHVDTSVYETEEFGVGRMTDSQFEAVTNEVEANYEINSLRDERRDALDTFSEHVNLDKELGDVDLAELSDDEYAEMKKEIEELAEKAIVETEEQARLDTIREAQEEAEQESERIQDGLRRQSEARARNAQEARTNRPADQSSNAVNATVPYEGRHAVSSEYGDRIHPITGERGMHHGIDFAMPTGTELVAAQDTVVVYSGVNGSNTEGYGNTVMLYSEEHDVTFLYAHLSDMDVAAGDRIDAGDIIGKSGATGSATGPHLHFEVRLGDVRNQNGDYEGIRGLQTADPANYLFPGEMNAEHLAPRWEGPIVAAAEAEAAEAAAKAEAEAAEAAAEAEQNSEAGFKKDWSGTSTSKAFRRLVLDMSANHQPQNDDFADQLMTVMAFETGGSFSPSIPNAAGSSAMGIIQFMDFTAKNLGTTREALKNMTAEEQMVYVGKYFEPYKGRLNTLEDAYLAVFSPAFIGKGNNHVAYERGSVAYEQNRGLDLNGDGKITVGEIGSKIRNVWNQY